MVHIQITDKMEHSFSISVAKDFSVGAAIIVRHLQYWILLNRANKHNKINGKTWTYNTHKALTEVFTYWSEPQIKRILRTLVDGEVIEKAYHNKNKWDKTTWYAFTDEEKWLGSSELPEALIQTARADDSVSSRARPYSIHRSNHNIETDIDSDINTNPIKETLAHEDIDSGEIVRVYLPGWITSDSWEAFLAMRKKLKKPMSERAKKTLLTKLEKLKTEGHDPNVLLDEAEFRGWLTVYPPKPEESNDKNREYFRSRGLQV
jgi:hypothetical protein